MRSGGFHNLLQGQGWLGIPMVGMPLSGSSLLFPEYWTVSSDRYRTVGESWGWGCRMWALDPVWQQRGTGEGQGKGQWEVVWVLPTGLTEISWI